MVSALSDARFDFASSFGTSLTHKKRVAPMEITILGGYKNDQSSQLYRYKALE
jgi:hypothetical protein